MAVATPIPFVKARFFDRCGNVLAGGKVYTYEPHSTTPKVTYTAPISGTPNTNPIILDAAGEADIYLSGRYRIIVQDSKGVVVNDNDDVGSWYSGDLDSQLDSINQYLTNSGDVLIASQLARIDAMVNTGLVGAGSVAQLVVDASGKNQQQINDMGAVYWRNVAYPINARVMLSNGDIVRSTVAANVNNPNSNLAGWSLQPKTLADYGGIANYIGSPLYDGNDGSRITGTDNTVALQNLINDAIAKGVRHVELPAGHFAIKAGNLVFDGFDSLSISGAGIGITILDFIKEDVTATAYVDTNNAHAIATFKNGNNLWFSNLTIKATTKGGVVNGTNTKADAAAVYFGKVWGLKIDNVKSVRFSNTRVDRFNYRGISVSNADVVKLIECEGFNNTSSGWWISSTKLMMVLGGEYAYNGIFGNAGTGYGVTASNAVGTAIFKNVYAHNNYRKGLDTHGASSMRVNDCVLIDNVLYHCAMPNNAPPATATKDIYEVTNCTMHNGLSTTSEDWLRTCYQALFDNGFDDHAGQAISITDPNDRATDIIFKGNNLLAAYGGLDIMNSSFGSCLQFYSTTGKLTFANNSLNFAKHGKNKRAKGGYSHNPIWLNVVDWDICNNQVKWDAEATWVDALSVVNTGSVYSLGSAATSTKMLFDNNTIEVKNAALFGEASTAKNGLTALVGGYQLTMTNNKLYTQSRENLVGRNKWFTTRSYLNANQAFFDNNMFVISGVAHKFNSPYGQRNTKSIETTGVISKATGADLARIVVDYEARYSSIEILFNTTTSPVEVIKIWLPQDVSYAPDRIITNPSVKASVTINSAYVDTDGVTKIEILLKSISATNIQYYGIAASLVSATSSYGIEKIELL